MIPQINNILYATDLSDPARFAFRYAATVGNRFGAKITVFYVIEEFSVMVRNQLISFIGEERWDEMQKRKKAEFLDTIQQRLENFSQEMTAELQPCPFTVERIVVKYGAPADQILKETLENHYDLIVMGTHGYGGIAGALMGSNARRVVRGSKIPVMVVRLPE
jgi:nucleotide-binding universal stress UspA family protein